MKLCESIRLSSLQKTWFKNFDSIFVTASSSVPHTATEDVEIAGHRIPKDSIVLGFLSTSHLDAKNFCQPREFRPERFIDDVTGKVCKKDQLIPFSTGKHFTC